MYLGTLVRSAPLSLDAFVPRTTMVRRKPEPLRPQCPRDWGHFLTELSHGIWPETIRLHPSGQARDDRSQLRHGWLHRVFPLMNAAYLAMTSGTQTTVSYPNCGLVYRTTQERHPDKQSGSFICGVRNAEVHTWSGAYDFFGWKGVTAKSPLPMGTKI